MSSSSVSADSSVSPTEPGGVDDSSVQQGVDSPGDGQEAKPEEDNNSLDFDDLYKVPSTKEERGGLSRREWAKQNNEKEDVEDDGNNDLSIEEEIEQRVEKRMNEKYGKSIERLDNFIDNQSLKESKTLFSKTLEEKGISVAEFNKSHKQDFQSHRDNLVKKGLPLKDAVSVALQLSIGKLEAQKAVDEANNRASGRTRAKITPSPTVATRKTTYSQADLTQAIKNGSYNDVMDAVESGKAKIV